MNSLFVFVFSIFICQATLGTAVHLKIGESKKLQKKGTLVISKSNATRFSEDSESFTVTALKPGQSSARSGNSYFTFYVLSSEQELTYSLINKTLKNHSRLKVELRDGDVVVFGKLIRFEDWEILGESCLNQNCDYKLSVTSSSEVLKKFENQLSDHLRKRGLKLPALVWEPYLSTQLPRQKEQQLSQALKSYGISITISSTAIETEPSIKVQLRVVEIKKEASLTFGIDWPSQVSASLVPQISLNQNLEAILQGFERSGLSRTLASPTLLTRSGTQAEFLAGGELPIKTSGRYGSSVVWKKYGVSLKIKPQADAMGQLRVKLESEISRIDPSVTIDGVPGFLTHRTQNEFDLTHSKLIALSGLFTQEDSQSTQGIPGLSRLPIFGPLFSSQDFRDSKSELIIFVLPSIEGNEK